MKQFIVDRHTTPSTPALVQVPTEKLPVYDDIDAVAADLANLSDGQIGTTKDTGSELSAPVDTVQSGNMHAVTSNAVAESMSYSTTEQKTGGVWIDGKPIYRKVYTELNYSVSPNTWYVTDIQKAGIDEILEIKTIAGNGTLYNFIGCTKVYNPTYLALWVSRSDAINVTGLIIEYTKTTD